MAGLLKTHRRNVTQSTRFKMRALLRAGLVALCGLCLPISGFAQEMSIEDARALGQIALQRGEPQLALNIGKGLLQADPKDPVALLIVARAQSQLGNPVNGRRAAARAYRNTSDRRLRLDAATMAAGLALRANRPTLTQIWLRRAALHTNNEADDARIAQDYRRVRDANPWNFNVNFSLRPSSNVNNGAEGDVQIIDGLDTLTPGRLSGSAQALSGLIADAQVNLVYRLRQTSRNQTNLRGRVLVRRIDLSQEAREVLAANPVLGQPIPKNSDFNYTYTDLTLQHGFRIGERTGDSALLSFGIGAAWYGGAQTVRLARMEAQRRWQVSARRSFSLTGSLTKRDVPNSTLSDSTSFGATAAMQHVLGNGGRLNVSFGALTTTSDSTNRENTAVSVQTGYQFPHAWGPARASANLTLQHVDYPVYIVAQDSTGTIFAPGGRQDKSAYADLTLFFPDYDFAGFAPTVTLRAGRKSSNVSRFDTREVSVSVGIRSKF